MKLTKPEDLTDHTLYFEYNEREEVTQFLTNHNIPFKQWNGGVFIVKKECGKYILPDNINGMGYWKTYWHSDVKQFINVQPIKKLRSIYNTHNKAVMKVFDEIEELNELKEELLCQ